MVKSNKGQVGIGTVLILAIAIIVGVTLFQASAPSVATVNTKVDVVNQSVTAPAVGANSTGLLRGQAVSNVIVINGTSGTVIPSTNYTITNYVNSNGELKITFQTKDNFAGYAGKAINVSYTYEPFGYATDAGSRAVIGLVLVFGALAIVVIAVEPIRNALKELFE